MMLTPRWRRPSAFSMSKPTLTSSTGLGRERDADGVADAGPQQRADADRGLHRAGARAARLGDAEVQRAVDGLGQLLVGGDRQEDVGRLHADLELVEVVVLQDARVVERALDHRLGQGSPYFSSRSRSSEPALTPMRIETAVVPGGLDHLAHPVGAADVAGVDAQAGGAGLGRLDAALVVEVDVGHDRDRGSP